MKFYDWNKWNWWIENLEKQQIYLVKIVFYVYLVGVSSQPCPCCKKMEKKKHECSHEFCESNCSKKRNETNAALAEILPPNLSFLLNQNNSLKKKLFQGGKPVIFGTKNKEEEGIN